MAKADPIRAARWQARGDDWMRAAAACQDGWVAEICEKFASQSYGMAEFWGGI